MFEARYSGFWCSQPRHALFLRWLVLAGLMGFGAWMSWDMGLLQRLLLADQTRIGVLITLLFVLGSAHCAVRSWFLSVQQEALESLVCHAAEGRLEVRDGRLFAAREPLAPSLAGSYLAGAVSRGEAPGNHPEPDQQLLAQVMAEQARGQHEAGWFVASSLVKLGLLGTVIGFLLMLAPVTTLESFDQSQIQHLLRQMTVGMGVALSTTLFGLVGTILLGIQYLLVDRASDRLVAQTVHFADAFLGARRAGDG